MRYLFIVLFIGTILPQVQAQTIRGKVVNEKRHPVPYVNVVLQTADSVFISGTTSNGKGKFTLSSSEKEVRLLLSYIGYESQDIRFEMNGKDMDLGIIVLKEAATALDNIVVTGSNTVRKIDKQIIYPSGGILKSSSSGYDLLARLMLPDLSVDPIQRKIATLTGGAVEIRINDVKATMAQVSSLNPSEVLRVEYIDTPGARYGDSSIEAVINYIVKKRTSGVTGGIDGTNAVTTQFGNDNVYAKANAGKSELGVVYYRGYRDYKNRYGEGIDKFNLPDGTLRQRQLEGIAVPFGYTQQVIEASYNLASPDKYVFNALFTNELFDSDKQDHSQRIIEKGKNGYRFFKHGEDHSSTPSIDIYYSRSLRNNQKITANLVGTYIDTEYLYDYAEYREEETPLSRYSYSTDGKRYSLIGEAIYSKEWKKSIFSAGIKGNMAYTNNVYTGNAHKSLHMHNGSLYAYIQIQGKWNKLGYILGAGLSQQQFSQADNRFSFTTFRPSLSLSYPLLKNARIRYTFSILPSTPSLSQLSDVMQQNNDMEISGGNSGLCPYRSYRNRLTFSWNTKKVTTQLTAMYDYYDNPIMTSITPIKRNNGYMVAYIPENGKVHQNMNVKLNLQWTVVPEALALSVYGGMNWYCSEGMAYKNEYTAWNAGLSLNAGYKSFSLIATSNTRPKSLYGHYVNYGEIQSYVQLAYTHRNLTVGVTCMYPFSPSGWSAGKRIMGSPYVEKKDWTYIEDNGNMICLSFSWRFNYGRKYNSARKTMSNKDSDSGILK